MQQERNYSIDLLKTILAFLIVLHHSPSPFHDTMQPITTCAVPTFFMISGFLIFRKEISFKRIMKNAIRIMKIFLGALLIFYIWFWIRHEELYIPNFKDICLMVFANNEPLSGHLWYLMAYAYALIVIAIFTLKGKMQYLKYIAIIGLVLYFLFDIWHIYCNVPKYLTLVYCFRNFFFTAIPMMFIGSTVVDRNSIRTKTIAVWLIFFSICAWVEMNSFHVNHIADVYFFTIPLSFFLFSLFVNCKIRKPNILTKCGEKYSFILYARYIYWERFRHIDQNSHYCSASANIYFIASHNNLWRNSRFMLVFKISQEYYSYCLLDPFRRQIILFKSIQYL